MIIRLLFVLLFAAPLCAQVSISPIVMPRKQFLDQAGNPLAAGHVCTYTVGTSTPQVTYTDYTGGVSNAICDPATDPPHSDGILLDAAGEASIYVDCTLPPLKVVVYDQNLVLQWSEDGVAYPTCIQPQACPVGEFVTGWDGLGVPICAAGTPGPPGPTVCDDLTQVTNLYVNQATGNNTTGDGTAGLPWLTIQHAIDEGIPGIVCGRYIIHLQIAGTYSGNVILDSRIFAGGGGWDPITEANYPLVNITPAPDAYSWVEIRGDSANTETYILTGTSGGAVVLVSAGYLTLKGLTVSGGPFGVQAVNHAFVNLAGVAIKDSTTKVMANEQSVIHIDPNVSVNDAGLENLLLTVTAGATSYGILLSEGSVLTDWLTDGNTTDTGAIVRYTKGAGTQLSALLLYDSFMYFRGELTTQVSGITAYNSQLVLNEYNFDGLAPGTGTAIYLGDSTLSGQTVSQGLYTITNASVASRLEGASKISPPPNIVSATTSYQAQGGDTIPASVRGRDTFMSTAHLIDTVTFSATPAFNMNTNGSIKKITLTADVTSSTITNQRPGENVTFIICQDGVGAHTFAWPANVRGEEAIGATASLCSTQRFVYDQGATEWLAVSPMVKNQ